MKIYKVIIEDHNIQRDLCKKLVNTSGETEERKELWQALKKELEVHAVAEERHFYLELIKTDEMQEDARHGIAEHHELDEMIAELDEIEMSAPHWLTHMKKLADKVLHHLEDEEKEFFDKAKEVYSNKEEEKLASAYEKTMKEYRQTWPESIPGNE